MSEINSPPPSFEEDISPEVLRKFSQGDIQLDKSMSIRGEGENRRIYITVEPDDIGYQKDLALFNQFSAEIHQWTNKDIHIDNAILQRLVFFRKRGEFSKNRIDGFSSRYRQIPQDNSIEAIQLRQQLESEVIEFNDVLDYLIHLDKKGTVEVILPKEKSD